MSRMTKDWMREYVIDPDLRDNELIQIWAEAVASQIFDHLHSQTDALAVSQCPDQVETEDLPLLAGNNGALWSDSCTEADIRQQVRHSLQVMKRHGSPSAIVMQFGLAGLKVTVGDIWYDSQGIYKGTHGYIGPLAQKVTERRLDRGVSFDSGATFDNNTANRFEVPSEYALEFWRALWGKTTFVTLDVHFTIESVGRQGLVDILMDQWMPFLLPIHVRLLGAQNFCTVSDALLGDYGYWYGYGYGYDYGYGYAYGDWQFIWQGAISWALDNGQSCATLYEGDLEEGFWDDYGLFDGEEDVGPQWGQFLTLDEGSWDDSGIWDEI